MSAADISGEEYALYGFQKLFGEENVSKVQEILSFYNKYGELCAIKDKIHDIPIKSLEKIAYLKWNYSNFDKRYIAPVIQTGHLPSNISHYGIRTMEIVHSVMFYYNIRPLSSDVVKRIEEEIKDNGFIMNYLMAETKFQKYDGIFIFNLDNVSPKLKGILIMCSCLNLYNAYYEEKAEPSIRITLNKDMFISYLLKRVMPN